MSPTDNVKRISRWRLRLAEHDFTIQYRAERVYQIPDALSRLFLSRVTGDSHPLVEVEDNIPNFDGVTTFQFAFNELSYHVCTANCDHNILYVF